jgi:hypothetical protein
VADPVSWYLIRPGWKVVAADGSPIGKVDEITGDEEHDIFDGLAISESTFGKPRYIPAEVVAEITEGVVRLSLSAEAARGLEEFREPAAQERIEPSDRGGLGEEISAGVRGVESWMSPPGREHSVGIWGRIGFAFRRLRGR